MRVAIRLFLLGAAVCAGLSSARAQQANVGGGMRRGGSSFNENIHVGWGLNFPGGFFRFGQPAPGPVRDGGGQFGVGFGGGGANGFLNFGAGQGADSGISSQGAGVTVANGGWGYVADSVQRPFVIGVIPVVGGIPEAPNPFLNRPAGPAPIEDRLQRLRAEGQSLVAPNSAATEEAAEVPPPPPANDEPAANDALSLRLRAARVSSAGRPSASVAELKRAAQEAAAAQDAELQAFIAQGEAAEAAGNRGAARVAYAQALRRAAGPTAADLAARLKRLGK